MSHAGQAAWRVPGQWPERLPVLAANEVHVWLAQLNVSSMLAHYQRLLTKEELERAQRFYFERDLLRWTIAHGVLRLLLAHYAGAEPLCIGLDKNAYGKPFILRPALSLHFNLSHSGDFALYAFVYQREVGIDIERMRNNVNYDELAAHVFSEGEQEILRALPPAQKYQAFYHCWTRKEAYIKARGKGLSLPLNLFDVSLLPDAPAALLASREDAREVARWSMLALPVPAGYDGTIVVEGTGWHVRCWQWEHDVEKGC